MRVRPGHTDTYTLRNSESPEDAASREKKRLLTAERTAAVRTRTSNSNAGGEQQDDDDDDDRQGKSIFRFVVFLLCLCGVYREDARALIN